MCPKARAGRGRGRCPGSPRPSQSPGPALPNVSGPVGGPGAAAMELPAVSLKAIILVHWLLTVWGCMNYMLPLSYAWGNFSVLAVGIWAIVQRDSLDAIMMFLTGLLLTVLTDIIHISIFYPSHDFLSDAKRFSIGMAIFSLLLKPVSCYLVYRMYRERGGEYTFNIGVTSAGQDRSTYEPIDQPDVPPQWPSSSKAAQPPY